RLTILRSQSATVAIASEAKKHPGHRHICLCAELPAADSPLLQKAAAFASSVPPCAKISLRVHEMAAGYAIRDTKLEFRANSARNDVYSRILGGVVFAAILIAAVQAEAVQTNVELIIDDSGSMAQRIGGGRKIDVAKQVFSGLIQDLPPDAQIAVRTYGRQ